MFIKIPIPVSFYKGWKQLKIESLMKLGELCGLVFTGNFDEDGNLEFIGNEKCWNEYSKQLTLK